MTHTPGIDEDADSINFSKMLDLGGQRISNILVGDSDPALADMKDGELCFGLVSGTGKTFVRMSGTIYVFDHSSTITS